MGIDKAALLAEIQNDPAGVGYNSVDPHAVVVGATYVQSGDCDGLAEMLNAIGKDLVQLPTISGDSVKKLFFPCDEALGALTPDKQAKWTRRLAYLQGVSSVTNDAEFAMICNDALADFATVTNGMFSQARIDALTKQAVSRAVKLFGIPVTHQDVGNAIVDVTNKT